MKSFHKFAKKLLTLSLLLTLTASQLNVPAMKLESPIYATIYTLNPNYGIHED